MKKIFIGLVILLQASCVYMKGDYTLGRRNIFNDFFYTYNIRYYEKGDFDGIETETVTVSDYDAGVKRYAVPGGIVVSSKIYQRMVYSDEYVRPTTKGSFVSYTVPVEFSDEKVYEAFGETEIGGQVYRLLEPNRNGDVILVADNGEVYPRIGRVYNNRLSLLETQFILEPRDVKFLNETKNKRGEDEVVSGFDVRYNGLEDYQMVFTYNTVSPNNGMPIETSKVYKFPMYDKEVDIDGIKLEILNIGDTGLEYKILQ